MALEQVAGKQPIRLRWLDASHNVLTRIPASLLRWNSMRGLVVLNLNGNNISSIKQVGAQTRTEMRGGGVLSCRALVYDCRCESWASRTSRTAHRWSTALNICAASSIGCSSATSPPVRPFSQPLLGKKRKEEEEERKEDTHAQMHVDRQIQTQV